MAKRIFGTTKCAGCGVSWDEHDGRGEVSMGWELEMTIAGGKVYATPCAPRTDAEGADAHRHSTASRPENEAGASVGRPSQVLVTIEDTDDAE